MKPRLLVVELHHLGDAVMSLPFIRAASQAYEVHVLCRPTTQPIYNLLPSPPQIHLWEPPWSEGSSTSILHSLSAAKNQGQILRPLDFDAAVSVWADARIELLLRATQARRRIGFPMTRGNYYASHLPWRKRRQLFGRGIEILASLRPGTQPLLTDPLHRKHPRQHHIECWEQIAENLGLTCNVATPWFPITSPSPTEITDLFAAQKPILSFHPHARLPSKQWPIERWQNLLRTPAVKEKFSLVEILPHLTSPIFSEADATLFTPTIPDLAAAFAASDAILCHDSLPAHIAAALGKPVVTIFGSGEPDWFAPWNNRTHAVQQRVCPLHPCIDRCGMDSYICLNALTTHHVIQQLDTLNLRP